jgi:hypothetical protein
VLIERNWTVSVNRKRHGRTAIDFHHSEQSQRASTRSSLSKKVASTVPLF